VDHDTLPATAPKCTHEFVDFSAENLDPYVPYTIDAMEALVRGIDAAVKSGRAPQGPVLFNEIKKVSFAGVTGVVTFDENGDRGGNMGYSVFNHDGAGFNWIGFSQLGVFAPCSPLVNGPFTCVGTAHSTGDGSVPKQTVQEMNADTVLRVMVSRDTSYLYAAAEKSPVHGVGHITAGILPAMMYTSMSAVGLAYEFDFVTTVAAGNSAAVVARASATGAGAANTPTPDPPQSHNAALAESTTLCAALLRTKPGLGVSSAALVPIRPEDMLNSSHPCMDPSFVRAEIFETRLALQVNNLDKQMDILQASFSSLISPGVVALLSTLILSMFCCAHIIWLLERGANPDMFPPDYLGGIDDAVWWAAVTATSTGYGDKYPKTNAGRLFGVVWMVFGIVLFALFSGNVASRLVENNAAKSINSLGDLKRETKMAAYADVLHAAEDTLLIDTPLLNLKQTCSQSTCSELLSDDSVEALVGAVPHLIASVASHRGSPVKFMVVGREFGNPYSHYLVAHKSDPYVAGRVAEIPKIRASRLANERGIYESYFGLNTRGRELGQLIPDDFNWTLIGLVLALAGTYSVRPCSPT
jgi:hypothetical protein